MAQASQDDQSGIVRNEGIAFPPFLDRFLDERSSNLADLVANDPEMRRGPTDEEVSLRMDISRRLLQNLDILSQVEELQARAQRENPT